MAWLCVCVCTATGVAPGAPDGLTPEDLWSMIRVADPQPSPDGGRFAFVAREYDIEKNSRVANLWMVPAADGEPRRLTRASVHDSSPRWLPGGGILLFLSDRSGSSQIWAIDPDGGEPWQLSDLPLDVGNLLVSPSGGQVAFTLEVVPGCEDLECTEKKLHETEASKSRARVYSELLFRHWDRWEDGLRSHIFVAPLTAKDGRPRELGKPVDLMKGLDVDSPTRPFGGTDEIAFSPDGAEIAYTARVVPGSEVAWSTDVDIFRVPVDASTPPQKVSTENRAWDTQPAYSPDGRWLAHLAMSRPGFEADRFRILLRSRAADGKLGAPREVAPEWDRSAGSLAWTSDSRALIVTAQETGRLKIFSVDVGSGEVKTLVNEHHNTSVSVGAHGRIVFLQDSTVSPADLFSVPTGGGEVERLTAINAALLTKIEMSPPEELWFAGAKDERVHAWLVRPPGFRKGRRYPVALLVHGGPQGAYKDQFHYRWNPQIYAGAGYLTLAVNFHGSTGYGQAFTDSISGNWGGAPYEDLMKGVDHLLAAEPAADGERMCALGASYGGYMINWMAGQTDRFRCFVNHDGTFDLSSMYFTTEELWFPEWDVGGTPWENPDNFRRWSPSAHVDKWTTPMLVIHGAQDYRLPETEAFATFTALRRRGIPAKFLYFPDENHWVLRPANAMVWHDTVLEWLGLWLD
jgi:dipeptidyl aminopeptidase/acylaminoacyl peptidase